MVDACCCKDIIFGQRLLRSSACPKEPVYVLPKLIPASMAANSCRRESITNMNNMGDKTAPCLNLLFDGKDDEQWLPIRT